MEQAAVRFERDIRPLFREKDVQSMSGKFDLSSYGDVRANSSNILEKLADGSMPCDGAWPDDRVELFQRWIEGGKLS